MSTQTNLAAMLATLDVHQRPGEYVFASVADARFGALDPQASLREAEGWTVVLDRAQADAAGLAYDFVAAWLTLDVHSALAAVGLTAAVARVLAEAGIACNVLAGFHHDHLLVPHARAAEAMHLIRGLRG